MDKQIECGSHGLQAATFVCQHLPKGFDQGFFTGYDEEDPGDPFPDAWCTRCEQKLDECGGEWNDESEAFANITMICAHCYVAARLRNVPEEERRRFKFSHLEDIEETHKEHPRTFSIPRSDERFTLKAGQLVKLHFHLLDAEQGAPGAERMWVEVLDGRDGKYTGLLNNKPFYIADLEAESVLSFEAKHVAAVYFNKEDGGWIDESKTAKCHSDVIDNEAWPEYAEKKDEENEVFSGWYVYSSRDTARGDLKEIILGELLHAFPVLDSIVSEETGSSWQWSNEDSEYKRVQN